MANDAGQFGEADAVIRAKRYPSVLTHGIDWIAMVLDYAPVPVTVFLLVVNAMCVFTLVMFGIAQRTSLHYWNFALVLLNFNLWAFTRGFIVGLYKNIPRSRREARWRFDRVGIHLIFKGRERLMPWYRVKVKVRTEDRCRLLIEGEKEPYRFAREMFESESDWRRFMELLDAETRDCAGCGYRLKDEEGDVCPECGGTASRLAG